MVTIFKVEKKEMTKEGEKMIADIRGLSTDDKPTEMDNIKIGNGSTFIELDTQALFFFDESTKTWKGKE